MLGALRTGVVPVLLNATLVEAERDVLLADARPSLTVTDAASLAALDRGSPVDLAPYPLARPMHYTSGTTGRAKGVWSGVWDDTTAFAAFDDEADLWGFDRDDVHLVCSPMYHSVSVRFAAGTLLRGGTCIILSRFDAKAACDALSGGAGPVPTTTFMAPTALKRLLSLGPALPERFDALRLLAHAGSSCPPVVKRAAMERVGPDVLWEFYGSTEGQFTVCSPQEWQQRPGTVGRARAGRELTVDEDGTVWCRPPGFGRFVYWGDEEKTAAAWRDGAFTVGDLGRLDADGYLFLDGRRDDLIISGGVNVYPAEVEATLAEVHGVSEVAVFGVADETWGERVCAAVVPDGADATPSMWRRCKRTPRPTSLLISVPSSTWWPDHYPGPLRASCSAEPSPRRSACTMPANEGQSIRAVRTAVGHRQPDHRRDCWSVSSRSTLPIFRTVWLLPPLLQPSGRPRLWPTAAAC